MTAIIDPADTGDLPIWRIAWRAAQHEPRSFWLGWLAFVVFFSMPALTGYLLAQGFGALSARDSGAVYRYAAAVFAAETFRMGSVHYGAVTWTKAWAHMQTLLRANLLTAQVASGGPEAGQPVGSAGEALTHFRDDTEDIAMLVDGMVDVSGGLVFTAAAGFLLGSADALAAAVLLVPLAGVVLTTKALDGRIKRYRADDREATAAVTGLVGDIMAAATTVKVNNATDAMLERLRGLVDHRRRTAVRDRVLDEGVMAFSQGAADVGLGLVLLVSAAALAAGTFAVGTLALFVAYLGYLSFLPRMVGRMLARRKQAAIAVDRMRQLVAGRTATRLSAPRVLPIERRQRGVRPLPERPDRVLLEQLEVVALSARYPGGAGVHDISFSMRRGDFVVLTGPVGSGKSTLLRAVLGLSWRTAIVGEVRWNGEVLADRAAFMVPPNAAFLPQVPQLVSDSVRDNVGLGPVGDAELARALALAAITDDVGEMPDGDRTMIGPRGLRLSGGQRQRLATARALVHAPELVVLDDLSSAVDVETELRLWDNLAAAGLTVLAVSHRAVAFERADQVLRLDHGTLAQKSGAGARRVAVASAPPVSGVDPFPELADERERLAFSRASRDRMIERLGRVDPQSAADEFTAEYVEVTVEEALEDLGSPGAGDFFGRIDTSDEGAETWYIGRRHIEDDDHDPVVVDWRAPIAAPFYRATGADPLGVDRRRRFMLDEGELTAYLDEQLDDPDAANVAGGIPDPVLAEIGAERTGAMREIVATIQAEQDLVIRAPVDQVLVVQGGPGTGKTAVALHRAAYLLFEHRRRLARDGVLVIGPNRAFLDYIGNVLPSLGERSVRQTTALELCVPKVDITGVDDTAAARAKGDAAMLDELVLAAMLGIKPPGDDVVVPVGVRRIVFPAAEIGEWLERAVGGVVPFNQRRQRLRSIAQQELRRRTGGDDAWAAAGPLRKALDAAWPMQQPVKLVDRMLPGPRGKKRAWTAADQLLVDEANSILNGPPVVYGHVVVDEAQDHSAVALRVIGRRSPAASMTLVGDVAQSTTPAGQERWSDVFAYLSIADKAVGDIAELTIGYRVPEPILTVANRLLPRTGVDASASRSVRVEGHAPAWHHTSPGELATCVADVAVAVKHRHRLTGLVAPVELHTDVAAALEPLGLHAVDHLHQLHPGEVPLFGAEQVKGLEFDGVVVVEPDDILGDTPRGARLLYVAMTRAVQELAFVTTRPVPTPALA